MINALRVLALSILGAANCAHAASEYDFNNYTLDAPPPKGGKFTARHKSALTARWDKHGVVRLAVISDHNQGYDLWSGVELIDVESRKTYNVDAVRCFVSLCVYIGKVPPGKYFINRLYADSFVPVSMMPIRKTSASIRNALGSFDVRVRSVTDLGLVGIYREVESSRDDSFQTAFLGHFAEIALVFKETYRGFQDKYFGLTGPELHWDADWEKEALTKSLATRRFFADFSRRQADGDRHFFPTVLGSIYSLDLEQGLTRGDVGTMFMVTASWLTADRWVVGTEAGRLLASTDRGERWDVVDAFPRDEVVTHLFVRNGVLHAVTVSQPQAALKLYRAPDGDAFTEISRTPFAPEGKSKRSKILVDFAGARESLMVKYLHRLDLKKVRVLEAGDRLTVQLNSRQFASFDFATNAWAEYASGQPVHWAAAGSNGITLMSPREAGLTIIQLAPGLGAPRSRQDLHAVPRGGFEERADGTRLAILSLLDGASAARPPAAQIYTLADGTPPSPVRPLDDVDYFFDSELLETNGSLLLIDRVAPRVHRFVGDKVATFSVYQP